MKIKSQFTARQWWVLFWISLARASGFVEISRQDGLQEAFKQLPGIGVILGLFVWSFKDESFAAWLRKLWTIVAPTKLDVKELTNVDGKNEHHLVPPQRHLPPPL